MSRINGTIGSWQMGDQGVHYIIIPGPGSVDSRKGLKVEGVSSNNNAAGNSVKYPTKDLSFKELLEPENEEWLNHTLDLDDDGDSLEDFLDNSDSDGSGHLSPDDPRAKLIEKLKEESGYNDAKEKVMEKFGLQAPADAAVGANLVQDPTVAFDAALAEDAARDAAIITANAVEPEIAASAAATAAEANAVVDSTIAAGTSEGFLADLIGGPWLLLAGVAIVVVVALIGLVFGTIGLFRSLSATPAAADEADCGGGSTPIIVIDPGHPSENNVNNNGDPKPASNLSKNININGGASGNGIDERDKVLEISKVLKTKLEAKGYKVILTRDSNEFISNKDRAETANNAKAALFLRIHNDGNNNKDPEGFFFLYPDKQGSVNGAGVVKGPSAAVRSKSKEATKDLVTAMSKTLPSAGLKVGLGGSGMRGESANGGNASHGGLLLGSVLADVPVTLLEVGNLKSSKEARWLKSNSNINLLADSITAGVIKFAPKGADGSTCGASGSRAKVIETAKAEVGTCGTGLMQNGGEPQKYTKYTCGLAPAYWPWCAGFVGYAYGKSGVKFPKTCGADEMYADLVGKHPINSSFVPQPGDAIHKNGHIGLVYKVQGSTLWTIEGNKTACVGIFKYPNYKTSSSWENFGHPKDLE